MNQYCQEHFQQGHRTNLTTDPPCCRCQICWKPAWHFGSHSSGLAAAMTASFRLAYAGAPFLCRVLFGQLFVSQWMAIEAPMGHGSMYFAMQGSDNLWGPMFGSARPFTCAVKGIEISISLHYRSGKPVFLDLNSS